MGQGQRITDWQIETIRSTWVVSENGSECARRAGCSASAANAYIREHAEDLRQLRTDKKPEIADVVRELLDRTLSVAFESKKLNDASFAQLLTGIGILVDKHQLLTGK